MVWFLKKKSSQYDRLLEKWTKRHKKIQENLWYKHGHVLQHFSEITKQFMVGSLAGIALLTLPGSPFGSHTTSAKEKQFVPLQGQQGLILELTSYLPKEVRILTPSEETQVVKVLQNHFSFPISPELQGIRLNTSYGYIGQEQHLARFPGDTIDGHDLPSFGMAPGLGAYGYFSQSRGPLTEEENLREKYYIAVQTFLSPGYDENVAKYNSFFAFRKMLVVNPQNGKALIADIGDAGPASFTGKQLGGSPEVMQYLERVDGAGKGPVLYFFINDPQDKIPLGPISYN